MVQLGKEGVEAGMVEKELGRGWWRRSEEPEPMRDGREKNRR
jgi:hypothetical protein